MAKAEGDPVLKSLLNQPVDSDIPDQVALITLRAERYNFYVKCIELDSLSNTELLEKLHALYVKHYASNYRFQIPEARIHWSRAPPEQSTSGNWNRTFFSSERWRGPILYAPYATGHSSRTISRPGICHDNSRTLEERQEYELARRDLSSTLGELGAMATQPSTSSGFRVPTRPLPIRPIPLRHATVLVSEGLGFRLNELYEAGFATHRADSKSNEGVQTAAKSTGKKAPKLHPKQRIKRKQFTMDTENSGIVPEPLPDRPTVMTSSGSSKMPDRPTVMTSSGSSKMSDGDSGGSTDPKKPKGSSESISRSDKDN